MDIAESPLEALFEPLRRGKPADPHRDTPTPSTWLDWLRTLFPAHTPFAFAGHHAEMWEWVWAIEEDSEPDPFVGVWARGGGKALALDTPIPTPGGWTTMGDISIGDRVFAHDGSITNVVAMSEVSERACYRVRFNDGTWIVASDDHLWTVLDLRARRGMVKAGGHIVDDWPRWAGLGKPPLRTCLVTGCEEVQKGRLCSAHAARKRRFGDPTAGGPMRTRNRFRQRHEASVTGTYPQTRARTLTTAELATLPVLHGREKRWSIPASKPLQLPQRKLLVDPYLLGAWLGDGTSATGHITAGAEDGPAMTALLSDCGYELRGRRRGRETRLRFVGLTKDLRALGVLNNKHIPSAYLRASAEQRLALLQGLLDTDGTVHHAAAAMFTNTNEVLASQVAELARSLGHRPSVTAKRARLYGRDCGPCFDVRIPWNGLDLFRLARKSRALSARRSMSLSPQLRYIVAIEPVPARAVRCITVDHPDHLYLAGDGMVPTHNSTGAELAATALGLRGRRRYVLYVRETQDQADNSVSNIGSMLESPAVAAHYPEHATRMVGKYGNSRGWRRNRLRTAGGFTIDAMGLDSAARGAKVEEQRPDVIILDDIDGRHDSPATTAKKIETITSSILPAGSESVAVLAIQNLIIADGFFTRMTDGRAEYLTLRKLSGPHPAVRDLKTEYVWDEQSQTKRAIIVSGTPTWVGQSLEQCQRKIDRIGLADFLRECQHQVKQKAEGVALKYNETRHLEDLSDEQCTLLVKQGSVFGGLDFGAWRFAFVLRAVDRAGRVHEVAEYFSQRDEHLTRARVMHAICMHYECPANLRIWGDSANPQDIMELNAAFIRIGSPLRILPVAKEKGIRAAHVERANDALVRDALFYRRAVNLHVHALLHLQWKEQGYPGSPPDVRSWLYRYNATSGGSPIVGSRLQWEIGNWSYPPPKEGDAQKQDPDDHTADGADMIAADRYGLMSWWKPAKPEKEKDDRGPQYDRSGDALLERLGKRMNGNAKKRRIA